MAIDLTGNPFEGFSRTGDQLLRALLARQQMDMQREQLEMEKERLKLAKQKATQEQQQQEASLQQAIAPFLQMLQQPQQAEGGLQDFGQMPQVQQALSQAGNAQIASPVVSGSMAAAGTAIAGERQRRSQEAALEAARTTISREAERTGNQTLIPRFDAMTQMIAGGMDPSLVKEGLPPDQKAILDSQEVELRMSQARNEQEADAFATTWLQQQGILPAGVPLIPGAGDTLLNVVKAREDKRLAKSIDWVQEGLDFITARVGDSSTGSPFAVNPDGTLGFNPAEGAVTVDQAIGEWQSIIETYAPPEVSRAVSSQIRSGLVQRRVTRELAISEAASILGGAADPAAAVSQIRDALKGAFPPTEIDAIIADARRRMNERLRR